MGRHSLGRLTCTDVHPSSSSPPSYLSSREEQSLPRSCILDGQQRFTTLTLFLASIRDVLQRDVLSCSFSNNDTDADTITVMIKAQRLVSTISKMLFVDVQAMESWMREQLESTDKVEEGVELQFCRLIPTFCDRLSYVAAILPQHTSTPSIALSSSSPPSASRIETAPNNGDGDNSITRLRSSYSPDWHRPLTAKSYLTEKIEDLIRINQYGHMNHKERSKPIAPLSSSSSSITTIDIHINIVFHTLEKLSNQLLDGADMLVFPIDVGTGRTDGTDDLMVVYERLALRDATFCKPHRQTEYQSMDAVDLIRNLLLGTFSDPQSTIDFYRDQWLPFERYVGDRTMTTKRLQMAESKDVDPIYDYEDQDGKEDTKLESSTRGIKLLLESFLVEQRKDLDGGSSSSSPEENIMPPPPLSTFHRPPTSSSGIRRTTMRKTTTKRRRNTNNNKNKAKSIIGGQLYRDFEDWLTEDLEQRGDELSPSDHTRLVGKSLQQFAIDRLG